MILGVKKSKKWKMTPPPTIRHRRVPAKKSTLKVYEFMISMT